MYGVEIDEDLLPLEKADGNEPDVSEHDDSELDNHKTVKTLKQLKVLTSN